MGGGGSYTISGAGNTIANTKKVSFSNTGAGTGTVTDSALWGGQGSISYTSSSSQGFSISGAKTYSGGATLAAMSGAGILVVTTSSTGPANAPTGGPFGTGTLTLGDTKMRAQTGADITIGNPVTFSGNPTFTTATGEKSLIFTGDAALGATRTLTVETGSTVTDKAVEFSGALSGSTFGIAKAGAGTLILSGVNTYSGATDVSSGKLLVNGSTSASSTVTVSGTGSILGGTGTIGGSVTVNGGNTLAPGASIQSLATGALSLQSASTYAYEADNDAAAASAGDLTVVNGNLNLVTGALLTLQELGAGAWTIGEKLTLINYSGIWNGGLFTRGGSIADDSEISFSGMQWLFNYNDTGAGSNFADDLTAGSYVTMTAVPEPSAALLGLFGLLVLARRRREPREMARFRGAAVSGSPLL
jgi:autotransporter-associated beta strand protein